MGWPGGEGVPVCMPRLGVHYSSLRSCCWPAQPRPMAQLPGPPWQRVSSPAEACCTWSIAQEVVCLDRVHSTHAFARRNLALSIVSANGQPAPGGSQMSLALTSPHLISPAAARQVQTSADVPANTGPPKKSAGSRVSRECAHPAHLRSISHEIQAY